MEGSIKSSTPCSGICIVIITEVGVQVAPAMAALDPTHLSMGVGTEILTANPTSYNYIPNILQP